MMRLTWKEGATSKAHNMQVEASRNCFQVWLWSFLCCVGRHGWGQGGGLVKSGGVANPCTVQERLGCGLCPQGARHGMEESATVHGSVNSISKADRRAAVCALLVCSWVGFRWVGGCLCRWVGGWVGYWWVGEVQVHELAMRRRWRREVLWYTSHARCVEHLTMGCAVLCCVGYQASDD
jgi:hypothetical protein